MSTSIPLFILYGSATGNSEHIAKSLSTTLPPSSPPLYTSIITCEGNAFRSKCLGYWNRPPQKGKYPVLIITSTTGNGDAPENIGRFIRYLKRKENVEKQPLQNCCYAVLGLGDTNYDNFCASGKIVDKKMKELGGVQVCKLGMADEATGLEDVVEPWQEDIIGFLERGCGRFDDVEEKKDDSLVVKAVKSEDEETKSHPQDNDNQVIQTIIELSKSLNISIPSTIPDSSLPSLLPHSESNGLQESTFNTQRPRAPSFSTISSTSSGCHYNLSNPYNSPIISARYLTNTIAKPINDISSVEAQYMDTKRVLELTIGLPDDIIPLDFFQPGDSIGLIVDNRFTKEYGTLMALFQPSDVGQKDAIVHSNGKDKFSIQEAFLKVDITSPIKKRILLHLSQICTNPTESYYLKLLSSKLGSALYDSYIVQQQRNIVDIISTFSLKPSPQFLYDLSNDIAPRYYSVASSPYENKILKIALSIVDYTIDTRRKHGLASTFLEIIANPLLTHTSDTAHIQIFPKPPNTTETLFRLPTNTSKPLILIGPGTGIAPFIGFLSHLHKLDDISYKREQDCNEGQWRGMDIQHEEEVKKHSKKNVHVYFGCRYANHDYIYKNELETFVNDGYVTKLNVAFSRQGKKEYVQDLLLKNQEEVCSLILDEDAYVYICGDGGMAKDVQVCLCKVCGKDDDGTFLSDLKNKRRLVLDVWS